MDIKPSSIEKEKKCLSALLTFFDYLAFKTKHYDPAKGHEHSSNIAIQKFLVMYPSIFTFNIFHVTYIYWSETRCMANTKLLKADLFMRT
jgi:hypothetical protein